eukprot:TRINITY_DN34871_c0_g1_i1.p1 TRINITY_DN34871_c0_g1~~TRINITY_DN34871_c0_g1_i1.p1  ORF type:complete len:583 (-),score=96.04 TRINITY_DN34871_c0_g1_i1:61-1782(-)
MAACRILQGAVADFAMAVLRAPWWLLRLPDEASFATTIQGVEMGKEATVNAIPQRQRLGTSLLLDVVSFCHWTTLLRAMYVCKSWRWVMERPSAWRGVRLTYGWSSEAEMRRVLFVLQRIALRTGLSMLPEDPRSNRHEDRGSETASNATCESPVAGRCRSGSLVLSNEFGFPPSSRSAPVSPARRATDASNDLLMRAAVALSLPGSPFSAAARNCGDPMSPIPSPLVLCRHKILQGRALSLHSQDINELWLLQPAAERFTADPCRRAVCRFLLSGRLDLLEGRTMLEVHAGAGLVSFDVARWARSVTITTSTSLELRLVGLNLTLLLGDGTSGGISPGGGGTRTAATAATATAIGGARDGAAVQVKSPSVDGGSGGNGKTFPATASAAVVGSSAQKLLHWSGATRRVGFLPAADGVGGDGGRGLIPVYMYKMPVSDRGVKELSRQWHWDSGTAMRGLRPELLAPAFELIVVACFEGCVGVGSGSEAAELLQLASALLVQDTVAALVVAAPRLRDDGLAALAKHAPFFGFAVVDDQEWSDLPGGGEQDVEARADGDGGLARIMVLRRSRVSFG